jgi:hypothetical protein
LAFVTVAVGCAEEVADPPAGDEVRNGTAVPGGVLPEIGKVTIQRLDRTSTPVPVSARSSDGSRFCTGTLVQPQVVMTSAACLALVRVDASDTTTRTIPYRYFRESGVTLGAFTVYRTGNRTDNYTIDGYRLVADNPEQTTFDPESNSPGIALLHLTRRMAVGQLPRVATPFESSSAESSRSLVVYGFGSTAIGARNGGIRRSAAFTDRNAIDAGDLGGPIVISGANDRLVIYGIIENYHDVMPLISRPFNYAVRFFATDRVIDMFDVRLPESVRFTDSSSVQRFQSAVDAAASEGSWTNAVERARTE